MTFYAVHHIDTGELVSTGTVVADPAVLAERGLTALELTGDGPPPDKAWNSATLAFDLPLNSESPPVDPPTVTEALAADPDFAALSAAEKRITKVVARIAAKAARNEVTTE